MVESESLIFSPADAENDAKFLVFDSNPDAYWFDDYEEAQMELPLEYSENAMVS